MQRGYTISSWLGAAILGLCWPLVLEAHHAPGEQSGLGDNRMTQDTIVNGDLSVLELRRAGRKIFATPFNHLDGYGDGPFSAHDPISPGNRPTLQGNGTFLRINGLDSQTCVECHSILSAATVPFTFGIGGVGGANNNAIFQPTHIDMLEDGKTNFDGRYINPPFLFGSGGVQLLAKEMTAELQELKTYAYYNPGKDVELITKGVHFGVIRYEDGALNTSRVEGIDPDLIVRPFGRKGEFPTTRAFDVGAMAFHFGMKAVEDVGPDVDADGDGVANEILVGELSALGIFVTTMERPDQKRRIGMERGEDLFHQAGCAHCHIPELNTYRTALPLSFPEEPTDPSANVFFEVDLTAQPTNFEPNYDGGVRVPLFADLKRHDMGDELAESFGHELDRQFTTARLWGVADTAPYLHDGRALSLSEAILLHGGEGQAACDAFSAFNQEEKDELLYFLRSLHTPSSVGADLDNAALVSDAELQAQTEEEHEE